jgi:hypothetical protein
MPIGYFDSVRDKINQKTLRDCQAQALAACVMSVARSRHLSEPSCLASAASPTGAAHFQIPTRLLPLGQ